jgi:hypothetical protein
MKVFNLIRYVDVTGVSGTGIVATVVQFDSGKCVVAWEVPDRPKSIAVYDSLAEVKAVHLHDGKSILREEWTDEDESP